MNIVYFGNGKRAYSCLKYLIENGVGISLVVGFESELNKPQTIINLANRYDIDCYLTNDPNENESINNIKKYEPDLFILGGYSKILKDQILDIPKIFTLNLHGGELPKYRGSSPLNWAIINGENSVTISIIVVDEGIDTGDIIKQQSIKIEKNDTIKTLHDKVNSTFPSMLIEVIKSINKQDYELIKQSDVDASYYPRRFPSDGFILFDQLDAIDVHNYIRALTDPYPGAFSFYNGIKVSFLTSELTDIPFYGVPGRIYKIREGKLLVCCKDQSLWITKYKIEDMLDTSILFKLYGSFTTVMNSIFEMNDHKINN